MTVFISGVAGFLGSHLADVFLAAGDRVVGCDSLIGGDRANVPDAVEFYEADCADLDAMRRIMPDGALVYHCAATAYEGFSVAAPTLVFQNIVGGASGVFTAAIAAHARRIVFCSSMARYGAGEAPFTEDSPVAPVTPYGIAKVAAEQLLRCLGQAYGVEWAIAVPHNIIGPRQRYDDPYRNVAAIMINLMVQGRRPVIHGDGAQRRCFSDVEDCLSCLLTLGRLPSAAGETVNIGPDEDPIDIKGLAALIGELLQSDLPPEHIPARPLEVLDAYCNADKARTLLGYRTTVSLRDSLAHMIVDIRRRGPRPFRYDLAPELPDPSGESPWAQRLF